MEAVAPIAATDDNTLLAFQVKPEEGPNSASTAELVEDIRALPVLDGDITLGVAGQAAINIDISEAIVGVHSTGPILSFLPVLLVGILSGLAMDYQLFLASGMREAYTGAPVTERAEVLERLAMFRENGYAVSYGELDPDAVGVAAPVAS